MKKSKLRNIIRESIKTLMTEQNAIGYDCGWSNCHWSQGSGGGSTIKGLTVNGGQIPQVGDVIDVPEKFFDMFGGGSPTHTPGWTPNTQGWAYPQDVNSQGFQRLHITAVYGPTSWNTSWGNINDHGHDHDLQTIDYAGDYNGSSPTTHICPYACHHFAQAMTWGNPPWIPGGSTTNQFGQYSWDGTGTWSGGQGYWGCLNHVDNQGNLSNTITFGCIHPLATNYDSNATVDDGSCDFYGWRCVNKGNHPKFGKECVLADHYRTQWNDTKQGCLDAGCEGVAQADTGKTLTPDSPITFDPIDKITQPEDEFGIPDELGIMEPPMEPQIDTTPPEKIPDPESGTIPVGDTDDILPGGETRYKIDAGGCLECPAGTPESVCPYTEPTCTEEENLNNLPPIDKSLMERFQKLANIKK